MCLRIILCALCMLAVPTGTAGAASPASQSETASLSDRLAALDEPRIAAEIDPPALIAAGRAEIRPSPGARVFILAAADRPCGILIDGPAAFSYDVHDTFSMPIARRNADRADGLSLRDTAGKMSWAGSLRGAAIWGWNLGVDVRSQRPVHSINAPGWFTDLLATKLTSNPGRDMLLSDLNGETGYRWALLHTGGDDFMLDVDPRPSTRLESFHRVRRLPRTGGPFAGRWEDEEVTSQPIERSWWQPPTVDFAAIDYRIDVQQGAGDRVTVTSRTTFQPARDGLRALSLALVSAVVRSSGDLRPFTIKSLTIDGAAVPYVHNRNELIVLLPRDIRGNQSIQMDATVEGGILERPDGDTYWRLADEPWYPRPLVGGITRAAFHVSVATQGGFVPFAPGQILERHSEGPERRTVTSLTSPMARIHVLAGKYSTFTHEEGGSRIHASTYASSRKDDALRVARVAQGVRGCMENWLGVPYPFQDLAIVEITDWGWGQAPPGLIFVTQEAFLTQARLNLLDDDESAVAGVVSRGINERVAHEVAHGWFPHVAKVERGEETWLSESLAEYASAVCMSRIDARNGKRRFSRQLRDWKSASGDVGKGASIYLASHLGSRDNDWRDRQGLLYARGPLVLHAVRQELTRTAGSTEEGDRLFFTWIRAYIRNFTFKTGETRHLIAILNQITKKDWQPWFERYVYGPEAVRID